MEQDIYFKQLKLFNPREHKQKVYVYGAGSIGSHVVVGLAKIGIEDITVYDYDIVEEANIPAQFYPLLMEPKPLKIDLLDNTVEHFTGIDIKTENIKIDENFMPNVEHNSIHILAFDNIEARAFVLKGLEGFPVHLIDGRIGGFNWEKYYVNCQEVPEEYKKTLVGTFSELECGEKCLWLVNSMISSKIIADVVKLSKNEKPNYMSKGNAMGDLVISKNEV